MTRRWGLFLVSAAVAVLVALPSFAFSGPSPRRTPARPLGQPLDDRPNILFIMTNDQHKGSLRHMPNVLSHLKAKGTTFRNMVNVYPLCCPSRATIQRGQYAHNTGIFGNSVDTGGGYPTFDARDLEQSTIATWLDDAGYHTMHIGSYMNEFAADTQAPPGWDYFGPRNPVILGAETQDDRRAQDAMRELRAAVPGVEPFFMQIGFHAPHFANDFEERDAGRFRDERVPRTPAYNEKDVRDKPLYIRKKRRLHKQTNTQVSPACRDDETNSIEQNDCEWVRSLRNLQTSDRFVADAIEHLDQYGELDNTYIFFYSDNGNHWGEHRLDQGKMAPYETDINFPLIVRGPRVPEGRIDSRHLVGNHDLAPTFAEIGEARTPWFVDGTSFLRFLDRRPGNDGSWRKSLFVERRWRDGWKEPTKTHAYYVPPYEAVRQRNTIFIRYRNNPWTRERDRFREYYDLRKDPYQIRNSIFHKSVKDWRVKKAIKRIEALRRCRADSCRRAEGFPASD